MCAMGQDSGRWDSIEPEAGGWGGLLASTFFLAA